MDPSHNLREYVDLGNGGLEHGSLAYGELWTGVSDQGAASQIGQGQRRESD
jgi:hypothetical protein